LAGFFVAVGGRRTRAEGLVKRSAHRDHRESAKTQ
jgi:hypothetical protein